MYMSNADLNSSVQIQVQILVKIKNIFLHSASYIHVLLTVYLCLSNTSFGTKMVKLHTVKIFRKETAKNLWKLKKNFKNF